MEKFLCHPLVKGFLPPYLENIALLRHSQGVLGNLKNGLTSHLVGPHQFKLVMVKDIVCMLVTYMHIIESDTNSRRSITRLLCLDMRNIKRHVERQILPNTKKDAFWLTYKWVRRSNSIIEAMINLVKNWWENDTNVSPNMQDIIKKHIVTNFYEVHPTHYLQVSQVNLQ
jgi:hypothetical protein